MKRHCSTVGLRTLAKGGSLIFCNQCDRIIASVNREAYGYIKLSIDCSCGNHCSLEFSYSKTPPTFESIQHMPYEKDSVAICKRCGNKIFGVIPHRTDDYFFCCECACGEKYNIKSTFENRLGETLKQIKETR